VECCQTSSNFKSTGLVWTKFVVWNVFFIGLHTLGHTWGFSVMQDNSSVHAAQFEGFSVVQDNTSCLALNTHRCVALVTV